MDMTAVANTPPLTTRHQFILLIEKTFPLRHSGLTVELTRRRESKHPSPHQASYERRSRRSRPTTDCVKTLTLKVRIIINVRECDQKGAALIDYILSFSRVQAM